jgi:hypothetical protein
MARHVTLFRGEAPYLPGEGMIRAPSDSKLSLFVDAGHDQSMLLPVHRVILLYAKSINPDEFFAQLSGDLGSVQ